MRSFLRNKKKLNRAKELEDPGLNMQGLSEVTFREFMWLRWKLRGHEVKKKDEERMREWSCKGGSVVRAQSCPGKNEYR